MEKEIVETYVINAYLRGWEIGTSSLSSAAAHNLNLSYGGSAFELPVSEDFIRQHQARLLDEKVKIRLEVSVVSG